VLCPPNGRTIESSTNALVMDPLDRSSGWQRKVLPEMGYGASLQGQTS